MKTGRRHRGRELALRVIFELDGAEKNVDESLSYQSEELGAPEDVRRFASSLVRGWHEHREPVDAAITTASTNWKIDDLGKVERAVLRLATYELRFAEDAPPPVVIDEAVELAKRYAGDEAGGFVNGVLSEVARGASA